MKRVCKWHIFPGSKIEEKRQLSVAQRTFSAQPSQLLSFPDCVGEQHGIRSLFCDLSLFEYKRFAQVTFMKPDRSLRPRYSDHDFEAMAAAIGVDVSSVTEQRALFDQATTWYAAARGGSGLIPGAGLIKTLEMISATAEKFADLGRSIDAVEEAARERQPPDEEAAKRLVNDCKKFKRAADKLMRLLGVTEKTAADGLPDAGLEDALAGTCQGKVSAIASMADAIFARKINRPGAIQAADRLAGCAAEAKAGMTKLRDLTVTAGNKGRGDINGWIDDMLGLYVKITGRKVATSVKMPIDPDAGKAHGPLVRF
jgi:hypothetical protein